MSLSNHEYTGILEGLAIVMAFFWLLALPAVIITWLVMQ
jgi:hypothetical protein